MGTRDADAFAAGAFDGAEPSAPLTGGEEEMFDSALDTMPSGMDMLKSVLSAILSVLKDFGLSAISFMTETARALWNGGKPIWDKIQELMAWARARAPHIRAWFSNKSPETIARVVATVSSDTDVRGGAKSAWVAALVSVAAVVSSSGIGNWVSLGVTGIASFLVKVAQEHHLLSRDGLDGFLAWIPSVGMLLSLIFSVATTLPVFTGASFLIPLAAGLMIWGYSRYESSMSTSGPVEYVLKKLGMISTSFDRVLADPTLSAFQGDVSAQFGHALGKGVGELGMGMGLTDVPVTTYMSEPGIFDRATSYFTGAELPESMPTTALPKRTQEAIAALRDILQKEVRQHAAPARLRAAGVRLDGWKTLEDMLRAGVRAAARGSDIGLSDALQTDVKQRMESLASECGKLVKDRDRFIVDMVKSYESARKEYLHSIGLPLKAPKSLEGLMRAYGMFAQSGNSKAKGMFSRMLVSLNAYKIINGHLRCRSK